jgi:hypothetical protein
MINQDAYESIKKLADIYSAKLAQQISTRVTDMEADDNSHYLIYRVLGIAEEEGRMIDVYQNKGRFLYKYAGSFPEEAAIQCFEIKYPDCLRKVKIPNTIGQRPRTFEIDCLVDKDAFEIKWRDATTDGDHITKEHTRVKNVKEAGYKPIRIMFYYPNRTQAIRIQETIKTIYEGMDGEYYFAHDAWDYIKKYTGVDLLTILEKIADDNSGKLHVEAG